MGSKLLTVSNRASPTTSASAGGILVDINGGGGIYMSDSGVPIHAKYEVYSGMLGIGTMSNHPVALSSNNAERVRIDTAGNVGIGTTNPGAKLDVNGNANVGNMLTFSNSTQWSGQPAAIRHAGGHFYIDGGQNGTHITSQGGSDFVTISSSTGNVGIGNTAPAKLLHVGSASVGTGLAVANFQNVDGTCTITPASSGSGIACSSDERLKENFQDVTGAFALDRILQLQAVTYNFKTSSTDNRRTGYKAQEVQKVAPEFVRQNEDGLLQVYYDAFIPWITEAIKTLYSRITGVENHQVAQDREIASVKAEANAKTAKLEADNAAEDKKINHLEQENAAIKARLEKIEKALNSK